MFLDKIKAVMAYKGKGQVDLADYLGTSRQNVYGKFKRASISVEDLIGIADMCDCKITISDDTGFSVELNKNDLR